MSLVRAGGATKLLALVAQQAKLDGFVYALALLWLTVTHKYWQPEQRTKLSLDEGLFAGGGHMTWALLGTSHPEGWGCRSYEAETAFIFSGSLEKGV